MFFQSLVDSAVRLSMSVCLSVCCLLSGMIDSLSFLAASCYYAKSEWFYFAFLDSLCPDVPSPPQSAYKSFRDILANNEQCW